MICRLVGGWIIIINSGATMYIHMTEKVTELEYVLYYFSEIYQLYRMIHMYQRIMYR